MRCLRVDAICQDYDWRQPQCSSQVSCFSPLPSPSPLVSCTLKTMKLSVTAFLVTLFAAPVHVLGYNVLTNGGDAMARRKAMGAILGGSVAFLSASTAHALDMDAFANAQIEADKKNCNPKFDPKCAPTMTKDEALCKYGQSGDARGDACKRVKQAGGALPSAKPAGKSLGGAYAM